MPILIASTGVKPGLDQELELALVAEARDHAAVAGRIRAGHQQAAGRDELTLEAEVVLVSLREVACRAASAARLAG